MEFTGLGAQMAQLAGRLGSVDPAAAGRADLEWSLRAARRLRGMIDAREALVTCHLESMVGRGVVDEGDGDGVGGSGHGAGGGSSSGSDEPGAGGGGDDGGSAGGSGQPGANGGGERAGGGGDLGGGHRETAEEYVRRLRHGKWLRRLGLFNEALEAGVITTEHVEALAAVLDHVEPTVVAEVLADEAALLDVARSVTRASFARYVRLQVDRVRGDGGVARLQRQIAESFGSLGFDDDLGLHRLFVRLDPVRGERVYTAIRHRVEQLQQSGVVEGWRRGQVIAQAVTDLICGTATAELGGVEVLVVTDVVTLLHGHHDGSICETGDGLVIPVDVVRDLCRQAAATITAAVRGPDGAVVAVGHHTQPETTRDTGQAPSPEPGNPGEHVTSGGRGQATGTRPDAGATDDIAVMVAAAIGAASSERLHMGRELRLANRAQRRALRAMYRCCAHPGCTVPFADCFIHHIEPWEHDGPTDLPNLLPVCGRHHHLVHDGGWRLTIDPTRTLHWYEPGGTPDATTPFQPLGGTAAGRGGRADTAGGGDNAAPPPATGRSAEQPVRSADPATESRWTRSRSGRGSPPRTPTGTEPLRLFDPPAA